MAAARAKMIARRFGGKDVSKTGGKGSMRRKKKTVHKTAQSDDKRIGATLKKLGVSDIPGIEEVNVFKRDGAISASRRVETPSRHRRDSCPSDEVVGGFFFEFEANRAESSDRDAPRCSAQVSRDGSSSWRRRTCRDVNYY